MKWQKYKTKLFKIPLSFMINLAIIFASDLANHEYGFLSTHGE